MKKAILLVVFAVVLLLVMFFWPKANSRVDDDFTASSAGKSYYENFGCTCVGFTVPQMNCRSCAQYVDCYGIPVSCVSGCRKEINGTWQGVYCSSGSVIVYPKDKESCEAHGGRWGPIGLSPAEVCVLPTKDAGKICWDSSQCEGACVATLSQDAYERLVTTHVPIFTAGTCTASNAGVGCNAYVENGVVSGILCID